MCLMKQQQGLGWLLALGWGTANSKQMQFRPMTEPGTSKMSLYRLTLSEYSQKSFKLISQVVLEYKLQQLTSFYL